MATNFLIGRGELLANAVAGPRRNMDKAEVYTLAEAKQRLIPQVTQANSHFEELPASACPNDYAVARLTLNPSYIARSFFPDALLRENNLQSIGSKTVKIKPDSWKRKAEVTEFPTTEIFVAGKRSSFKNIVSWSEKLESGSDEAIDFARIEAFSAYKPQERIVPFTKGDAGEYYEIGLHLLPSDNNDLVQTAFISFANDNDIKPHADLSFTAGNLWFIPVQCAPEKVEVISLFTFVRVIRPVPPLRGIRPMQRAAGAQVQSQLPVDPPVSDLRAAILDGGLPQQHSIHKWLNSYRVMDNGAADDQDGLEHGLAVTSAFLFGPLKARTLAPRPYSYVDHLRVLDNKTCKEDPLELYRTLGLIEEVLLSRQYQFLNLSLGPNLPIEDSEVHAWTSVIDDLLSDGETLMTIAVGNNGEMDRESGNARIQVPADSVNGLSVGSANSVDPLQWSRSSYSAIGPGRSPGVIKPDLIAFGGDENEYFHVLTEDSNPVITPQMGTSFSAPYALRTAVGIKALLGGGLTTLAIKALMIHSCSQKDFPHAEVGWGKLPEDLDDIIISPAGVARIVYQGELKPGKYLRAALPIPDGGLNGMVNLTATFCYSTSVDPQDSASYTKAGLEISFRPNEDKKKQGAQNADTKGFFELKKYANEQERRSDMGKWETVLHATKGMRGSSLNKPVFDIHYNARQGGAAIQGNKADKIKYALILTITAKNHPDLYNEILRSYNQILAPIQPQATVPVRA
ncbi:MULTISPECIES: S8 family peptidase [Erwiniaceae]|uniref:S8 family peptidase n=1 Tax=Enterobacter agglomerans TaxID=549 RepID=A0ACC5RSB7_ENTAG|nr:S8 family peptidase [Pantoea agglomerans]MBK4727198.1 S8 family peptidase [Pantoea agglomerans]